MDINHQLDILAYKEALKIRLPKDSYICSLEFRLDPELHNNISLPDVYRRYDWRRRVSQLRVSIGHSHRTSIVLEKEFCDPTAGSIPSTLALSSKFHSNQG